MKKALILIILTSLLLSGCMPNGLRINYWSDIFDGYDAAADRVIEDLIAALKRQDIQKIVSLFSANAQTSVSSLEKDAADLCAFVSNEIVEHTVDNYKGIDSFSEHGKKSVEVKSDFVIKTATKTYYVAIMLCVQDTFNKSNEGIQSFNIIAAEDWLSEYHYGPPEAEWKTGINIEREPRQ